MNYLCFIQIPTAPSHACASRCVRASDSPLLDKLSTGNHLLLLSPPSRTGRSSAPPSPSPSHPLPHLHPYNTPAFTPAPTLTAPALFFIVSLCLACLAFFTPPWASITSVVAVSWRQGCIHWPSTYFLRWCRQHHLLLAWLQHPASILTSPRRRRSAPTAVACRTTLSPPYGCRPHPMLADTR